MTNKVEDEPNDTIHKACSMCGRGFPRSGFYRNRAQKDGLTSQCRECSNFNSRQWVEKNREAVRERRRRESPEVRRDRRLLYAYGLPAGRYGQMLLEQENKCAICRREFSDTRKANLDHCHNSNKIRGLLCRGCNQGIGHLEDSIEILLGAVDYLLSHLDDDDEE